MEGYVSKKLRKRAPGSFPLSFGKEGDLHWQDEGAPPARKYCLDCREMRKGKYQESKESDKLQRYGRDADAIMESNRQALKRKRSRICLGQDANVPKPRKGAPNHWCELCKPSDFPNGRERKILGPHFFGIAERTAMYRRVRMSALEPVMRHLLATLRREHPCFYELTLGQLFQHFRVFKRSTCFKAKQEKSLLVHKILGIDPRECLPDSELPKRGPLYLTLAAGVWHVKCLVLVRDSPAAQRRRVEADDGSSQSIRMSSRAGARGRYVHKAAYDHYVRVSPLGEVYKSSDGGSDWHEDGRLKIENGTLWKGSTWRLKIQGSKDETLVWSSKYSRHMRAQKAEPDKMIWQRISTPPEEEP